MAIKTCNLTKLSQSRMKYLHQFKKLIRKLKILNNEDSRHDSGTQARFAGQTK